MTRNVLGILLVFSCCLFVALAFVPLLRLGYRMTTAGKWRHMALFWSLLAASINASILGMGVSIIGTVIAQPFAPNEVFDERVCQIGSTVSTSLLSLPLALLGFWAAWGYLLETLVPLEKAAVSERDAALLESTSTLTWWHLVTASLIWSGACATALAVSILFFIQNWSLILAGSGIGAIIGFLVLLAALRIVLRRRMSVSRI
jgi:hypothetical protein